MYEIIVINLIIEDTISGNVMVYDDEVQHIVKNLNQDVAEIIIDHILQVLVEV